MKIKTSELTGVALDYACIVAGAWTRADGAAVSHEDAVALILDDEIDTSYSTDWSQGGPIIEREVPTLFKTNGGNWVAQGPYDFIRDCEAPRASGPTPLLASMRAYVASKLGDEVEIPNELMEN